MTVEKLITDHINIWSSAFQTRSTAGRGSNGKIDLYGIKKLRELILELAVRGKLVPQDPNDEPASELLKRIAVEKAELVQQGKIKKQKPLPEISEDEKPFELPKGWEWVRLGSICSKLTDGSHNPPKDNGSGYPMLSSQNIQNGLIDIDNPSRFVCEDGFNKENNRTLIQNGDVLLTIVGSLGRSAVVTNNAKFVLQRSVAVLTSGLLSDFLSDYFKSITAQFYFIDNGKGTAQKGIYLGQLSQMLIPVPSLVEQERIVIKINELMSLCDQLEQQSLTSLDAHSQLVETLLATLTDSQNAEELAENWARISQHFDSLFTTEASIDALKQTILQLAVMGKLVPQDPHDEPASELLKRIEQEKAQLVKEGKIKKQKPLPPISDDEKPFELPVGWEWCRLPDLGELARGKSKHRPRNDPALYVDGKYPLVQTGDVSRSNGVIKTFTALYNELGVNQSRMWPKGTLCITIAANIADSGILAFDACFPDSVVGYSPFINDIPVKYFDFFMRTMKSSLEKYAPSTAQKNINLDILSQVFVPCPPLNEFGRVVCKVETLFSLLDTLKSRLQSAQQTQLHLADALTDAALS